jgi:hypothetical protein
MSLLSRLFQVGVLAIGVAACAASTRFTSTWAQPSAQPLDPNKKVATVMMSRRESQRRSAELAMADEIRSRGIQAVESFNILPGDAVQDTVLVRRVLVEEGVDAVLVMRVVGKEQQMSYTPGTTYYIAGPYYSSTWGYWGYGWGAAYSPGYMTTQRIVSVESLVYSVSQGRLLWAGVSETTNPEDLDSFIRELVRAVGGDLREKGLIRRTD